MGKLSKKQHAWRAIASKGGQAFRANRANFTKGNY
jgi:hypothetical protein